MNFCNTHLCSIANIKENSESQVSPTKGTNKKKIQKIPFDQKEFFVENKDKKKAK